MSDELVTLSSEADAATRAAAQILADNFVMIPDFPELGIRYLDFYRTFDYQPLVRTHVVNCMVQRYRDVSLDGIAAIGTGGFSLGACLSQALELPMIPIRKAGDTVYNAYISEVGMVYATRKLSLSKDLQLRGKRVLLVDDTIASGGTFSGGIDVLTQAGAKIIEIATVFETISRGGRARVAPYKVFSILSREEF